MKRRLDVVEELCAAIEQEPRSVFNIAQAARVSAMTLHLWLNGKTTSPKVDTLDRVARVLGKRLAYIEGQWALKPIVPQRARRPRMALWRWQ
jgi:transcriptional regulator with XRE-family HTH domain